MTRDERKCLIEKNIGLAHMMAKKCWEKTPSIRFYYDDLDDLISTAKIAICTAADHFDPDRGYKFSTYCCQAIYKLLIAPVWEGYARCPAKGVFRETYYRRCSIGHNNDDVEGDFSLPTDQTTEDFYESLLIEDEVEVYLGRIPGIYAETLRHYFGINVPRKTIVEIAKHYNKSRDMIAARIEKAFISLYCSTRHDRRNRN